MSVWKVKFKPMNGLMRIAREQGYNLHSVSENVGLPYMSVYRWANGICAPSNLQDMKRIADFLHCTIDDLIGD